VSALDATVDRYLMIRRSLGYQLLADGPRLHDFAAYLDARGTTTVTVQAALAWACRPPQASRPLMSARLTTVRGFAAYLAAFDPDTQIPPAHLLAAGVHRRIPYLYTPTQIEALMAAAAQLPGPLRAASWRTLIGLMAATGLRTGEAVRLQRQDVDLAGGLLLVRGSKNDRTRQLPLHPSTVTALSTYTRRSDQLRPRPADTFLISDTGAPLGGPSLSRCFRGLLAGTGIAAPPGRRPPRLYDLRHTFAVATLLGWHADRLDVQPLLPVLSTYLGHVNPAHTYWYLQAVPELMSVLADRLQRFLDGPR